jgi:hypothetical protein
MESVRVVGPRLGALDMGEAHDGRPVHATEFTRGAGAVASPPDERADGMDGAVVVRIRLPPDCASTRVMS